MNLLKPSQRTWFARECYLFEFLQGKAQHGQAPALPWYLKVLMVACQVPDILATVLQGTLYYIIIGKSTLSGGKAKYKLPCDTSSYTTTPKAAATAAIPIHPSTAQPLQGTWEP